MSETAITDALADHFRRTWGMVRQAVQNFPEEGWRTSQEPRMLPARIGYHILMSAERYTWPWPADQFTPERRRFGLNWEAAQPYELPDKEAVLGHLDSMETETLEWLRTEGDAGLIADPPTFPWTGGCALGQALYLLRHLQHHLAELNVGLRRRGLPAAEWK